MVDGKLHELIDQSKWEYLLEALKEDADLQSETRRCHKGDLPLHLVCENKAPDELILQILKLNPDAVKQESSNGNLPLHIAVQKNIGQDVLLHIIRLHPAALDYRNNSNLTPREYPHKDLLASQALERPTYCWHQLVKDETREEQQEMRLENLQKNVSSTLSSLSNSDSNIDSMMTRLDHVEKKVRELESLKTIDLDTTVSDLKNRVQDTMNKIENRLKLVENDVRTASSRSQVTRAATRAHQSDILKMQRTAVQDAKKLTEQIKQFKISVKPRKIAATIS